MSLRAWLVDHLLRQEVDERVQNAIQALDDDTWRPLTAAESQRPWQDVRALLERVHRLVAENPLAARLVRMTTDFVIGSGAQIKGPPFVHAFWQHPLNHLDLRIYRWCDELSTSGELFLVLSRNPVDGMSYVREIPAQLIDEIDVDPDDLEHELRYHQLTDDVEGRWWPAARAIPWGNPEQDQVMLHYTINRPVGALRGVSDLAQIVPWLERYAMWLEDRVRINRFKGAYLWHVKVEGALKGQLAAKRRQYRRPPAPGSIIVSDASETWSAIQPNIQADDVAADGKALRLMIAAGAGVPLHFLAEGESANRATAREMGTATFRHFSHRQAVFTAIVEDVLRVAAWRAGHRQVSCRVRFEPVLAEDPRTGAPDSTAEPAQPSANGKEVA